MTRTPARTLALTVARILGAAILAALTGTSAAMLMAPLTGRTGYSLGRRLARRRPV